MALTPDQMGERDDRRASALALGRGLEIGAEMDDLDRQLVAGDLLAATGGPSRDGDHHVRRVERLRGPPRAQRLRL